MTELAAVMKDAAKPHLDFSFLVNNLMVLAATVVALAAAIVAIAAATDDTRWSKKCRNCCVFTCALAFISSSLTLWLGILISVESHSHAVVASFAIVFLELGFLSALYASACIGKAFFQEGKNTGPPFISWIWPPCIEIAVSLPIAATIIVAVITVYDITGHPV